MKVEDLVWATFVLLVSTIVFFSLWISKPVNPEKIIYKDRTVQVKISPCDNAGDYIGFCIAKEACVGKLKTFKAENGDYTFE